MTRENADFKERQQRIAKQLQSHSIEYEPSNTVPAYSPYHQAAAVLVTYDDKTLMPFGKISKEASIEDVLADSKLVSSTSMNSLWMLLPEIRKEVLKQLGNRTTMQEALAVNHQRLNAGVQKIFEAYIAGTALPLEEQDITQIAETFQVCDWLDGILDGIPTPDQIRQRYEKLTLLQPFEQIAGSNFRGRRKELQTLRTYVGVHQPGSLQEYVNRIAEIVFNWKEKPPLMILGPGGRGKSALVARFILEHATLPGAEKFPWAYIDFDRPSLSPEEPFTILIEAVRQLSIQYPAARLYCDRIRLDWQKNLERQASRVRSINAQHDNKIFITSRYDDWERAVGDFANLLRNLKADDPPFLLVLDTFEVVQYRSQVVVDSLLEFLQLFQKNVPRLRTVIAGRAPITEIPEIPIQTLELKDFDIDAAQGFLVTNGNLQPPTARLIAQQVGGNPLSLKLALDLWQRWQDQKGHPDALELFRFREQLTEADIQGTLFARILERIENPDVRKLAHPGLVLRRITDSLIREVLSASCGVVITTNTDAVQLFEELRREVSLVTYEDGILRHRDDVRKVMIRLLRKKEPDKVRLIEEAAVAYYQKFNDPASRAEEIYHRLSLKQSLSVLDERWIDTSELKTTLFSALEEIDGKEKIWLASRLGVMLKETERTRADLLAWERDTEQRIRELIISGQYNDAIALFRERNERTIGSSLYVLEVETLERLGKWKQALEVVKQGIESCIEAGNRPLATDLKIRGAGINLEIGSYEAAENMLKDADKLVESDLEDPLRLIALKLAFLDLIRLTNNQQDKEETLKNELTQLFEMLSDEQIVRETVLMKRIIYYLANEQIDPLRRVIESNGLATSRRGSLRSLAREIAFLDDNISREASESPGFLARQVGLPQTENLTEAWTHYVLNADPKALGQVVSNLLKLHHPKSLVDVIISVVGENLIEVNAINITQNVGTVSGGSVIGIEIGDWEEINKIKKVIKSVGGSDIVGVENGDIRKYESTANYAALNLRLSKQQYLEFSEALLDAFPTRNALVEMLRFRLGRNLESIAFSDDLQHTVISILNHFEKKGTLAQFLVAARDANPSNPRLREFAAQFGLAAGIGLKLEKVVQENSFLDPDAWRTRLGFLETQICRVEIDNQRFGTGFLVGPDLLFTAYFVVEQLIKHEVSPSKLRLRFDYKRLADGRTINPGTVFRLSKEWLVDTSPYSSADNKKLKTDLPKPDELSYALLRIEGDPGAYPIGGEKAERTANKRGWVSLPDSSIEIIPEKPIQILHHPKGEPLKISMDTGGIVGLNSNGTRIYYRCDTEPGSSGAPCFDFNWNLMALHLGKAPSHFPDSNMGVPFSAILELLKSRGKGDLLNENNKKYRDGERQ